MRHFLSFSCGAVTAYIQVSCYLVNPDWLLFCLSNRASWVRHVLRYWASQSPTFYDSRLVRLVTYQSAWMILLLYYYLLFRDKFKTTTANDHHDVRSASQKDLPQTPGKGGEMAKNIEG